LVAAAKEEGEGRTKKRNRDKRILLRQDRPICVQTMRNQVFARYFAPSIAMAVLTLSVGGMILVKKPVQ
jgi:hypothetical protein